MNSVLQDKEFLQSETLKDDFLETRLLLKYFHSKKKHDCQQRVRLMSGHIEFTATE